MRVCIEKSTGKLIEAQSGGETHPDPKIDDKDYADMNLETLRQNAINLGYNLKNIEIKFVTNIEYQTILDSQTVPEPTQDQINENKIKAKMRELAIVNLKADGELPQDYQDALKKSLTTNQK